MLVLLLGLFANQPSVAQQANPADQDRGQASFSEVLMAARAVVPDGTFIDADIAHDGATPVIDVLFVDDAGRLGSVRIDASSINVLQIEGSQFVGDDVGADNDVRGPRRRDGSDMNDRSEDRELDPIQGAAMEPADDWQDDGWEDDGLVDGEWEDDEWGDDEWDDDQGWDDGGPGGHPGGPGPGGDGSGGGDPGGGGQGGGGQGGGGSNY